MAGPIRKTLRCGFALLAVLVVLQVTQPARAQALPCFGADAGAASTNWNVHFNWAQDQDLAGLKRGLNWKLAALFRCPSRTDDQLADTFADISVIIARYVPSADCFKGDLGVVSPDWAGQRRWAKAKGRHIALPNLQWKASAALDCLDRAKQRSYFADVSVVVAGGKPTGGDAGGSGTAPANPVVAEKIAVPPPPPPPPMLALFVQPANVQVYVDDVFKGVTSTEGRLVVEGLAAGTHRIRLNLLGFVEVARTVELKAGETAKLDATLAPAGPKPLQESEIEEALKNGVSTARLKSLVEQYGVDFAIDKDKEKRLRDAGADAELLYTISQNKK